MTEHYFTERPSGPSDQQEVVVDLVDPPLRLRTDRGVFSHGRLDPGTELLLRAAPPPPSSGTLCDLGCGTGAIALTLGRRSPAARIVAVDVNERARRLCILNALRNGVDNVEVHAPEDVEPAMGLDLIWSNPPIRIGKPALHSLLTGWLGRLTPTGAAVLVVHKHLGSDSLRRWLINQGWPTDRLASSKGYRLLHVGPDPDW